MADRAKLYSLYLDLLNDHEKVQLELVGIEHRLDLALGSKADLHALSEVAAIEIPSRLEISELVRQALGNRADYRRLDVEVQALRAAEAVVRSEDGFHFKYIQPEYSVGFDGDQEQTWSLSAAFVLPWGTRSPDVAVYQRQRMLAVSAMDQHRRITEERLQVLLNTAYAFKKQIERRNQLVQPLVEQLEADLGQLEGLPLEQQRDRMAIRRRILDTALQAADAECERQRIAIDFAEELGSLGE